MAIRIISEDIKNTGIGRLFDAKDSVLTKAEVSVYNEEQFGGSSTPGVLDNLLALCDGLNLDDDSLIQATYTTDNGTFFSIPYIQLSPDPDSVLSLVFAKVIKPLIYNPSTKSYSIEGCKLELKPHVYIKEKETEIKGVYFAVKFEVELDGLSYTREYTISCKTPNVPDFDFRSLAVKLQKGDSKLEGMLQKLGTGGSFRKAIKAWMVDRGIYQVTDLEKLVPYMWNGKQCFSRNATITAINPNTGELGEETFYVSVLALPFNATKLIQCEKGYNYLVKIDGGYLTDEGKNSTIGYSGIVGLKLGAFKPKDLQDFVKEAAKECIAKRKKINTGSIFTLDQVEEAKIVHLAPKVKTEQNTSALDTVKGKEEDIPF